ncbi:MAG: hypothetical protein HYX50_01015 [Chloroflexi bacterium]|nr:hypothetical protein [Chloroflexota bacterium]
MPRVPVSRVGLSIILIAGVIAAGAAFVAWRDGGAPPARAQTSPPANDNFAQATDVGAFDQKVGGGDQLPFEQSVSTAGATLEQGEAAPCAATGATVWYSFRPQVAGTVYVTTAGSSFDTVLYAATATGFVPSPPGQNLAGLACDDNGAGGTQAALSFPYVPNEQYFIQAGGKAGASGDLKIRLECRPACPPQNDNFGNSLGFGLDGYQQDSRWHADTTAATLEPGEPAACGNMTKTVWYTFYGSNPTRLVIDTAGSNFPTAIAVYTYDNFSASPPGNLARLACGTSSGATPARLVFDATEPGNAVLVQIGGVDGAGGELKVNFSCDPACPPYNDRSMNAGYQLVGRIEDAVNTQGATVDPGEPAQCAPVGHTVWYGLISNTSGITVSVDTTGSTYDTVAAVYDAQAFGVPYDQYRNVTCVDNAGGPQAKLQFRMEANKVYAVQIGGRGDASGDLNLIIDCVPAPCPPADDTPGMASFIGVPDYVMNGYTVSEDIRGATTDPSEPLDCGPMAKTTWYQVYSSVEANVVFDTRDSEYSTALAAYDAPPGSPPGGFRRLGCDAPGAGRQARLSVPVHANQTIWVQAGAVGGEGGTLVLRAFCDPACPPRNDNVGAADYMYPAQYSIYVITRGATLEPDEPRPCADIGATAWYQFTTGTAGTLTLDVRASDVPAAVALYRVDGLSPPGGLRNIGCAAGVLDAQLEPNTAYYVQVGGVSGAGGALQIYADCQPASCAGSVAGPEDGGPIPGSGGPIRAPDTGSGGYLPGSH